MIRWLILGLFAACCIRTSAFGVTPAPGAPAGVVILATECNAGDLIDEPSVPGGKASTSDGEYHPLISAKLPAGGDAFTVWVHRKSGPIQLKAIINGGQQEKLWNWATPGNYEWTSMGRYSRADAPDGIVIIRSGKQSQPNPAIDCIVFSTDAAAHPKGMKADGSKEIPPESPDDTLASTCSTIRIDWNKKTGQFKPSTWGVNDYEILNPDNAASAEYQKFLASLHPTFIRIHQAGLADDWTDPTTRSWRVDKIKAGFAASTGYGSARIMLNVPNWPSWLPKQADGTLTTAGAEEFVALIGQLVRVMRDDIHQPIAYWELLNERDDTFEKLNKLDELWTLQNRLYAEIKKQDPAAKVGGPAFTWPKPIWVESFLKTCGNHVDFITWHNYASGDILDSNDYVFDRADAIADQAKYMKDAIAKALPNRKVEMFLDEYNIKWTWDPIERRHGNNVGAVFQACLLRRMAALDLDGVSVWQAKGHAYGLIDGDNTVRLTGRLYQIGSQCLVGDTLDSKVDGDQSIELIAVRRADGVRSILLINRADHAILVSGVTQPAWRSEPAVVRIASDGFSSLSWKSELHDNAIAVPGYSVVLLTEDDSITQLTPAGKGN